MVQSAIAAALAAFACAKPLTAAREQHALRPPRRSGAAPPVRRVAYVRALASVSADTSISEGPLEGDLAGRVRIALRQVEGPAEGANLLWRVRAWPTLGGPPGTPAAAAFSRAWWTGMRGCCGSAAS